MKLEEAKTLETPEPKPLPRPVEDLMVDLLLDLAGKTSTERVLDPACGTGDLLLRVHEKRRRRWDSPPLLYGRDERHDLLAEARALLDAAGAKAFLFHPSGEPTFETARFPWNRARNPLNSTFQAALTRAPEGAGLEWVNWAWRTFLRSPRTMVVLIDEEALWREKDREAREKLEGTGALHMVVRLSPHLYGMGGAILVLNWNFLKLTEYVRIVDTRFISEPVERVKEKILAISRCRIRRRQKDRPECYPDPQFYRYVFWSDLYVKKYNLDPDLYIKYQSKAKCPEEVCGEQR